MTKGKVAVVCIATVIGVNFLASKNSTVRRVWAA